MPLTLSGTTGASLVAPAAVVNSSIAAGAVTPDKTQLGALPSMIRLNTANGYGSTSTCIRRFANITNGVNGCVIQGTDITFADSATLGSTFTVNTNGVYCISYTHNSNATAWCGISLNTTQPNANIAGLTNQATEALALQYITTVGASATNTVTMYLPAGSVIRPHTAGNAANINNYEYFIMTRAA
jgi:hypothetical protein